MKKKLITEIELLPIKPPNFILVNVQKDAENKTVEVGSLSDTELRTMVKRFERDLLEIARAQRKANEK